MDRFEYSNRQGWKTGLSLKLYNYGDQARYGLNIAWGWAQAFIPTPFLIAEPTMGIGDDNKSYGFSWRWDEFTLHLYWGKRSKVLFPFWERRLYSNDVQRGDGSWEPYVGSWELNKTPDQRHEETFDFTYTTKNGTVQSGQMTVHVQRYEYRPRCTMLLPIFRKVRQYIECSSNIELGNRAGSWKGGTVGWSYEMRPGENMEEALHRAELEKQRTFDFCR